MAAPAAARPPAFDFGPGRRPRRPSLTPLVDVVFLLLVFFMLAARFGPERALPLAAGAGGGDWQGPPRLVTAAADGPRLNGAPMALTDLAAALLPLLPSPDAPVVVRGPEDADVQAVVDVLVALARAGITNVVVVE